MADTDNIFHLTSSRFGNIEIKTSKLINVPEGIIGFPDLTRYALLDPSGGKSLFLWLQAVDNPDLAFIIANPLDFIPDYVIDTSEPDIVRLGLAQKSAPALFVIVTVPENDPDNVSANLLAPILFFKTDNSLYQIVLEKADWPLRWSLLPHEDPAPESSEVDTESPGEVR